MLPSSSTSIMRPRLLTSYSCWTMWPLTLSRGSPKLGQPTRSQYWVTWRCLLQVCFPSTWEVWPIRTPRLATSLNGSSGWPPSQSSGSLGSTWWTVREPVDSSAEHQSAASSTKLVTRISTLGSRSLLATQSRSSQGGSPLATVWSICQCTPWRWNTFSQGN